MLKTYLMENYGYNEPIFLNDLTFQGLSVYAVRQAVKRLVANGFLERYDNGIYYIPKRDGLLGKPGIFPFIHNTSIFSLSVLSGNLCSNSGLSTLS